MVQEIISIVALGIAVVAYIEVKIMKEQLRKEKLEQRIKELTK